MRPAEPGTGATAPLTATTENQPPAAPSEADPPARVGRVSRVSGTVSYHPAGAEQWDPAQLNWPVTSGSGFWTEPSGTAELELPSGRILMAGSSEFDVDRLDARQLAATVRQGDVYLRVSNLAPDESYRLQTPRGLVTVATPGRYEISVGNTQLPTRVAVYQGAAQIGEGGSALQAVAGQAILISGNDPFAMRVEPAGPDRFQSRTAPATVRRPQAVAPPPIVADMPGGTDLVQYGSWEPNTDYGQVWYPQVAAGWVPYREGHWGYVEPWGWTWIDAAPWGFAPFHYGRWLEYGGRWGWTPGGYAVAGGPVYPPVYAPALVTFFGIGAGVGLAAAYGNIGWVPLGPREAYHPWYNASPAYVRNVNYAHVTNITPPGSNSAASVQNFRNFRAATQVPGGVMTGSRPVGPAAQALRPAQFTEARPFTGQPPVRPSLSTAGITPGIARQLNLASPGNTPGAPANLPGAPARRSAPGPAVLPQGRNGLPSAPLAAPDRRAAESAIRPGGMPPQGAPIPAGAPPPSGNFVRSQAAHPPAIPPSAGFPSPALQPHPASAPAAPANASPANAAMPPAQPRIQQPLQPHAPQPVQQPRLQPSQAPLQQPHFQAAPQVQQPRVQPSQPPIQQPHIQPQPQIQQPHFQQPQPVQQPHFQPPQPQMQQPHFQPPPQMQQPHVQPPPQMQQPHIQPPPQMPRPQPQPQQQRESQPSHEGKRPLQP